MSKKIGEWRQELQALSIQENPPVKQANEMWRVVERGNAWEAAGRRVFDDHLERFQSVATTVLGEKDPKFELPQEDRVYAAFKGRKKEYSSALRKGIAETLALLGSRPQPLTSCSDGKPELVACLVVRELLSSADPVLWASLNDVLPLLSEANPREFLESCESSLSSDQKPFEFLFGEEQGGVFGATYMSGLLWALENLAWSSDYLSRVALVLGALAAIDPGGNWGNRPSGSLFTIFCPWFPQTCASVEKRVASVKALQSEFPDVGWQLLLKLLPSSHQSSSGSHKPKWRKIIPEERPEKPTNKEYWEQVTAYAELAVSLAMENHTRLPDLIPRLPNLPAPAHASLLEYIASDAVTNSPDDDRSRIWNSLQQLITKHRKFADADWAMPPSTVQDLETRAEALKPSSPVNEHKRLFTENDFELMSDKGDYEAQRQELDAVRKEAIREIYKHGGLDEILEMVQEVEAPWRLGYTVGSVPDLNEDRNLLPEYLASKDNDQIVFAKGYVWGRYQAEKWDWVDSIDKSGWSTDAKAKFYTCLPFSKETWDRVKQNIGVEASEYWQEAGGNIYEAGEYAELGIELLIQNKRAHSAIRGLQSLEHQNKTIDPDLASSALEAALKSDEDPNRLDVYATVSIIKSLQKNENFDREKLANLEWAYLSLLDRHSGGFPITLQGKLANDPDFFCEIIRMVYRGRGEKPPAEEPSEKTKSIASNAYRLLHDWRIPPGSSPDGRFDGGHLKSWVSRVKKIASPSGHLAMSLQHLGNVLYYSQKYADQLWLPNEVANILNQADNDEVRRGLTLECFNSRGVHGFTHGKAEREIATDYRSKAEAFELAGYPRLAISLRELAESYERDAAREEKRNPYGD
jgi:hypothetical protein